MVMVMVLSPIGNRHGRQEEGRGRSNLLGMDKRFWQQISIRRQGKSVPDQGEPDYEDIIKIRIRKANLSFSAVTSNTWILTTGLFTDNTRLKHG